MKKIVVIGLLILFTLVPVFSQSTEQLPAQEDYNDESVFIINSYNYNVKGHTRDYALDSKTKLKTGEEIKGFSNLEIFIENKKQLLINERVLKDNVRIEYTIGEIENGKYPVDLEIYVQDTWNIIALPYPKYDSNSGLSMSIKARDYNFLGTMSPLKFDIEYSRNKENQNFFSVMLDSDIPIYLFDLNWNINFDHDYSFRPDMELQHYYKNTTGLSLDLPVKNSTLTIGFNESIIVNEENDDIYQDIYGEVFQKGVYMISNPFISWEIPTPLAVERDVFVTYIPKISARFNHEISTTLLHNKVGPFMEFTHSIGFEKIDWKRNFKKGYSLEVNNSYTYDFYKLTDDNDKLTSDVNLTGMYFLVINDFMAFSSRLMYRHYFNTYNLTAGDALRGILDKNVPADYIVSINLDLPIRVFRIQPSQWFNSSKWRILDFDFHASPVIDAAFFKNKDKDSSFDSDNFLLSGGFEFIVFPDFFRSLFFRVSICFDLKEIKNLSQNYEIFLGMELHY